MSFSEKPLGREPVPMPAIMLSLPESAVFQPGGIGALWTLFSLSFRQFLRGKRILVVLFLSVLPAGLALLVRNIDNGPHGSPKSGIEFVFLFNLIPHALLPLTALLYGTGLIVDEQEEQTLTYLLIRPLSKWSIYVTKFLAALCMTGILVEIFVLLTYAATYLGSKEWWDVFPHYMTATMGIMTLSMMAYVAVFGLLGLLVKRSLIAGIAFIGLFEGLLVSLEFAIRQFSVMFYFRVLSLRWLKLDTKMQNAWRINLEEAPSSLACVLTLLLITVFSTAFASWIFSRNEFHVKTPESN